MADESTLETYNGYPLGCLVPESFPVEYRSAADVVRVMTLDEIRSEIVRRGGSLWSHAPWSRGRPGSESFIKDQGPFGACNGYALASVLEKLRVVRGLDYVALSGADAYSQMNDGRDRGSTLARGMEVCQSGIAPEALVKQNQIFDHQIPAAAKESRKKYRGFEAYAVDTQEELASGIIQGFLGVIAVHVTRGFDTLDSEGCVSSGNGLGNHAVHVDDLSLTASGQIKFDSPNSWNVTWGDKGRCYYLWDRHLRETVRNHRFWLLCDVRDPQPSEG